LEQQDNGTIGAGKQATGTQVAGTQAAGMQAVGMQAAGHWLICAGKQKFKHNVHRRNSFKIKLLWFIVSEIQILIFVPLIEKAIRERKEFAVPRISQALVDIAIFS